VLHAGGPSGRRAPQTGFVELDPHDEGPLNRLLEQAPYENVFFFANLQVYGWRHPDVTHWGMHDRAGQLRAAVGRRGTNYLVFDPAHAYATEAAALLNEQPAISSINGIWSQTHPVIARITGTDLVVHPEHFCTLPLGTALPEAPAYVRNATLDDVDALTRHYNSGETRRDRSSVQRTVQTERVYIAEVDGYVYSSLVVVGPTRHAGLIVAVLTAASARGRGYATACVTAASRDLLAANRVPCLFWRNPVAGRVYARIGFRKICDWLLSQRRS